MRNMRKIVCVTILPLLAGLTAVDAAKGQGRDEDAARRHYGEAMAAGDLDRRIALLARSFEERETYVAAIGLGEAILERGGDPARAREWLDTAYRLGRAGEPRARALFRIAESYRDEDERLRYLQYLEASLDHHHTALVDQILLEERSVGREVSRDEIVQALSVADIKAAAVRPKIDLRINFELDSDGLTREGREQAETLGEALRTLVDRESPRRVGFLVVGHTDAQGSWDYNEDLSMRRARTVRDLLVYEFGLNYRDIEVDGRGENELLSDEWTEAAHAVNRRVEVIRR